MQVRILVVRELKNAFNKLFKFYDVFCLSFPRIIRYEKEIQTNMKMCTGIDVSLAQYFDRKLNTDDRCHWGHLAV